MTTKNEQMDMSPHAIARRLEEIRGLCDLMSYLAKFRPLAEAAEAAQRIERERFDG